MLHVQQQIVFKHLLHARHCAATDQRRTVIKKANSVSALREKSDTTQVIEEQCMLMKREAQEAREV